ncbi:ADP-ribosylglycohydrolase [Paraphaeosphaeria sporulosa]|uniref:ADP-ribosylglycohydrolase n=1 Tax=Paraphaeosphaeria sporulosa TaxID=1460663 RepID=A0A177CGT5_9PLEO|nr:ADP-ribosylglycohydrolase [Paraphaeosphaeria sporulosa]OAG06059.1 ADP-ribosylglycohydrolase [Paraphaeosphaeria sporulosa]
MSDFVLVGSPIEEPPIEDKTARPSMQPGETNPNSPSYLAFLDTHPFVRASVIDKIYGCIVGSALGDTIGLYTEFLPKNACETIYKSRKFSLVEPVTEIHADTHRLRFTTCSWTDDTDQALLILLSYLHHPSKPLTHLPQDFAARLQIWLSHGLLALSRPPAGIGRLVGSVVTSPSYLASPVAAATAAWERSGRNAAPNGSLMRTHPLGVIGVGLSEEETWDVAAAVSRTTHADPRCSVACLIVVGLIRGLLRGEVTREAHIDALVERAYAHFLSNPSLAEAATPEPPIHFSKHELTSHTSAPSLDALSLDSPREMGYVYKALGAGILSLRMCMRARIPSRLPPHTLFEDTMTDLIMHGGDADTNAAVAGALVGAYLGHTSLPPHWREGLVDGPWLEGKVARLCARVGVLEGRADIEEEHDEQADGGKGLLSAAELEARDRAMVMSIMERKKAREEQERKGKGKGFAAWFGN